jgi:hypothetical protein
VRSVVSALGDVRNEIARGAAAQADQFRRRKDGWDIGATLGLWAAAAVGVWAIVSSKIDSEQQRSVMQQQLDEMQAEQRAWVSPTPDLRIDPLLGDRDVLRADVRIGLQNTGKNPATGAFVHADMSIGTSLPHGSMQAWQTAVCAAASKGLGVTLFPGSPEPTFKITIKTDPGELAERRRQSANVVVVPLVVACVSYQDAVTKRPHRTPFAYQVYTMQPLGEAIPVSSLPLTGDQIVLRPWVRGNLPPD